jgi:ABC-type Fe3+/spermidine/putrescine transport system ATPase subunit
MIYVTHDQTEALSLSDRVGILRDGRIEQIASPLEVHDRPVSVYAARLCGPLNVEPAAEIRANGTADQCEVTIAGSTVRSPAPLLPDKATTLGVRPYLLSLHEAPGGPELNSLPATVVAISMVGNGVRYDVDIGGTTTWHALNGHRFPGIGVGDRVNVVWEPRDSLVVAD